MFFKVQVTTLNTEMGRRIVMQWSFATLQCPGTQYKTLSLFPGDAEAVMSKWGPVAAHTHKGLSKNALTFATGVMWHALAESCIRRKAVEDREGGAGLKDTQMWVCVPWNQLFLAGWEGIPTSLSQFKTDPVGISHLESICQFSSLIFPLPHDILGF